MSNKQSPTEKFAEGFSTLLESHTGNLKDSIKEGINLFSEKILAEIDSLNKNLGLNLETPIQKLNEEQGKINKALEELSSKTPKIFEEQFTRFHEETEKIIDMTAALTVELSNKLETIHEKINNISESYTKQQDLINELNNKIKSQIDRIETVIESRLDGLKKQIEEKMKA